MSAGYPSNQEEAGEFHTPSEFNETQERHDMTAMEIGIIVGTVVAFSMVLFFILYCRHMEQRRRAKRATSRPEEGINQNTSTAQQQHSRVVMRGLSSLKAFWPGRK